MLPALGFAVAGAGFQRLARDSLGLHARLNLHVSLTVIFLGLGATEALVNCSSVSYMDDVRAPLVHEVAER